MCETMIEGSGHFILMRGYSFTHPHTRACRTQKTINSDFPPLPISHSRLIHILQWLSNLTLLRKSTLQITKYRYIHVFSKSKRDIVDVNEFIVNTILISMDFQSHLREYQFHFSDRRFDKDLYSVSFAYRLDSILA